MQPTIDTHANAQAVVDLFRSMLASDPEATRALFARRVACNQALADHPTIIVRAADEPWLPAEGPPLGRWDVGVSGLINGLFGPSRRVATICDDETGEIQDFRVVDVLGRRDPGSLEVTSIGEAAARYTRAVLSPHARTLAVDAPSDLRRCPNPECGDEDGGWAYLKWDGTPCCFVACGGCGLYGPPAHPGYGLMSRSEAEVEARRLWNELPRGPVDFHVGVDLANGPDATVVFVDGGVSPPMVAGGVRPSSDLPPDRSRVGETMRADYATPGFPTTADGVCVKDRDGWITCHVDEGHTLTAFAMKADEWDRRMQSWIADGSPASDRTDDPARQGCEKP